MFMGLVHHLLRLDSRRMHRVAALLSLIWPLAPGAGAQTWLPAGGPPGGDVRALAADPQHPNRLYLGSADGYVYHSEDAGRRWERTVPGFPLRGMSLDDIVLGPGGELFVGYWEVAGSGGGVARSTDGGRSFAVLAGMAGQSVRALALAPSDP